MTQERPEVTCMGEALIDLVSLKSGVRLKDVPGFLKSPGGAPANVAVMVSRMHHSAGFVGKVGDDPFGEFLRETLSSHGVDTSYLFSTGEARTGLAFVTLTGEGERDFLFYRHPGADMLLDEIEVDHRCLEGSRVFHFGSLSLSANPIRTATLRCLREAKNLGLLVTFDPNLRLDLWSSEAEARRFCMKAAADCDVLKVSLEEATLLSGDPEVEEAAAWLLRQGPRVVVVTLGARGAYFRTEDDEGFSPPYAVDVVDTTAAGDAFMGCLIACLLEMDCHPAAASHGDILGMLTLANAAGALASTRRGAMGSLPTRQEVLNLASGTGGSLR